MHRDKSCLLCLSLARAPFAQTPIKSRVFATQGHSRVFFMGEWTRLVMHLQLHKDKEEFVQVCGRKLHKSLPPPTQRFVLGELIMCSQAGGSWVDGADELPSSFTRRYVMGTRCQSAFCNQPVSNPAVMDRNIWAQWPRGSSMAWNDHGWGSCFDHNKRHNKRCGGCVTRILSLLSIFSPNNKPLNFEEGESTRDTKNKHCCFAMCARVHILWVFLKIRLRDKPGPLYCR